MFMGEYAHNLDAKGRIIIPAKFREELGEEVVVTRGMDCCLNIYTKKQWNTLLEQLTKLPSTKADARKFVRAMGAKTAHVEIDAQGRIKLPLNLIALAHLEKECMVVGVLNYVEIWAKDKYEAMDAESNEAFETIAESLTEFML